MPDVPSTLADRVDRVWIDRLVDLQVIAAHGDLDAAFVAEQWLARDPRASRLWNTIQQRCRQVRVATGAA